MLSQTPHIDTPSTGLIPADPLGQRLITIFSHHWHHIYKDADQWQTNTRYPISPRILWEKWQSATEIIGVRFGNATLYALLDIDIGSPFHPENDPAALASIRAALETIGIYRSVLIRSSRSRGLHLYIPLPESVPTYGIALALKFCLEDANLPLGQGKLEVFPNCKSYQVGKPTDYHGHRLPLQEGSFLLSPDGELLSNSLNRFLSAWQTAAGGNDISELREAIAAAVERNKAVSFRSQGKSATQWQADNEKVISEGWTEAGQTNELIKVIARHGVVFKGLSGDALIEYVHQTAIDAPGYAQFCNHHKDIERRCKDWSRSAERRYQPYRSHPKAGNLWQEREPQPDQRLERNNQTSLNAVERIRQTAFELRDWGISTIRGLAREIAAIARCSIATLYKHLNLWHPSHNGCNSRNDAVEPITDTNLEPSPKDPKSLEPSPSGLLHPNAYKKVVIAVTASESDQTSEKTHSQPPQTHFSFDFCDRDTQNRESPQPETLTTREDCDDLREHILSGEKNSLTSVGCSGCCYPDTDLACQFFESDRRGETAHVHLIEQIP